MRQKIVYVTTLLPYPPDMGGKIKTLSTLKQLVQKADVYLFSFVDKKEDLHNEWKLVEIGIKQCFTLVHPVIAEKHRLTQLKLLFYSLLTPKPYSVFKYYSEDMVKLINGFLSKNKIDIFWVDHTIQTQYLPTRIPIQDRSIQDRFYGSSILDRYKRILETHNFKTDFFRDMFFAENKLFWKLFSFYDWMKFRFYEPGELKKFDLVYAISSREKEKIARFNRNVKILFPKIEPTGNIGKFETKKLFFVGLLTWYPNKQGISWFIKEVFPQLKKEIPQITLDIVGDYSPKWKLPKYKGVVFHGYQKDLRPFWRKSSIFIVPLWYGSGIRIKILEALANRVPVVATSKAADGLPEKMRKQVIIVDEKEKFYRTIRNLLTDRDFYFKHITKTKNRIICTSIINKFEKLDQDESIGAH